MFGRGFRLPFRLLGIPVILDWSFLIIVPLMAWIIASQVRALADMLDLPGAEQLTQGVMPWIIGLTAALGLFLSVLLHELGHSITAKWYGVRVKSITLWFLGGVAQFEEMPRQRGAEAVVAIVGPIVSVALGAICWLAYAVVPQDYVATKYVLGYLWIINWVLAAFNMIPALPLDGGRVLRSLLALKMPHHRATQVAGGISKFFAVLLAIWGIFGNFWLLFVALFIYMAGSAETRSSQIEEMLRGMPVGDLMNRRVRTVPSDMRVRELTETMLRERHLGFPVVDDGVVRGIVTLHDVENHGPDERVHDIMTPKVATIREDADATDAFHVMSRNDFNRLIVVGEGNRMVGIITKTDLMRAIQLRSVNEELAIPAESPTRGQQFEPYQTPTA